MPKKSMPKKRNILCIAFGQGIKFVKSIRAFLTTLKSYQKLLFTVVKAVYHFFRQLSRELPPVRNHILSAENRGNILDRA